MEPARGVTTPERVRSSVDLPAPLEPTIDTMEPAATSMSTPHRTCMSPYPASRLRTQSEGGGIAEKSQISASHGILLLLADPDVAQSCGICRQMKREHRSGKALG